MNNKKLTFQPLQSICDDEGLRIHLWNKVLQIKAGRKETQKQIAETLCTSLTKIKEIESGTIKDFNALNNYLNYMGNPLF